jgi:hypothetical protein
LNHKKLEGFWLHPVHLRVAHHRIVVRHLTLPSTPPQPTEEGIVEVNLGTVIWDLATSRLIFPAIHLQKTKKI